MTYSSFTNSSLLALRSGIILVLLLLFSATGSGLLAQTDTPDPARFEQEIDAFANWDAKNSSPEDALLFVGSSSIGFWDSAEAFPGYPVINRGFGGSHITDVLYYFDRVIGRFDPSLIVFYCGENDIASGLDSDLVFNDFTELLTQIDEAFPDTDFLYVSIKPSNSRLEHTDRFEAFNKRVETFMKTQNRLHYIDLASPLIGDNGLPDDTFFVDDRLHLNSEGYRLWNEKIRTFLAENF